MADQSNYPNFTGTPTVPMKAEGELVPRFLLRLMIFLIVASLALVSFAVLTDRPLVGVPEDGPIAAERMISLEGTRSGAITVRDDTGNVVARMSEREAGFISVIWRGLDRYRKVKGAAPDGPVRLIRFETGRHTIVDPSTGWRAELNAFGDKNEAAFARLLD